MMGLFVDIADVVVAVIDGAGGGMCPGLAMHLGYGYELKLLPVQQ